MMVYDKRSQEKICHFLSCDIIDSIPSEERGYITLQEAKRSGYEICSECNLIDKYFTENKEAIAKLAKERGLSFRLNYEKLEVKSKINYWAIIVRGRDAHLELFHKNSPKAQARPDDYMPGYHYQKCHGTTLLEICEYIANHDQWRVENQIIPEYKAQENSYKPGTKKYKKQERKEKNRKKSYDIRKTLTLIESLSAEKETFKLYY